MKLIKNGKVLRSGELQQADILVDGRAIKQIAPVIEPSNGVDIIDAKGHFVPPGFVGVHVHLYEPGGEYKETIKTDTKVVARSGFTAVYPMPNTRSVPDFVGHSEVLQKLIDNNAQVHVLPYASTTTRQLGKELADFPALVEGDVFAFTDDGVGVQAVNMMHEGAIEAVKVNKVIIAHHEGNPLVYGDAAHEGKRSKELGISGTPDICGSVQVARDVLLAEAAGCRYHVCHVSTKESVRIIRDARRAGIHVTAEVTSHHLLLAEDGISGNNAIYKMDPPLRNTEGREALLEGLLDGTIDCIVTGHTPHARDEEAQPMEKTLPGIVDSETAFPLLYTHFVENGDWTLRQLVDYLTTKPCEAFDLEYGTLEENGYADLTIADLDGE